MKEKRELWFAYPWELRRAVVVDRPNRFVLMASVEGGPIQKVHLGDPGRLTELGRSGWEMLVRGTFPPPACPWRAVAASVDNEWVSLRPTDANALAATLIERGYISELTGGTLRTEVRQGRERFDLAWAKKDQKALIEVKSASLVLDGVALFPDAVSDRASRHVNRLIELKKEGWEPWVIFVCQRVSANVFRPADNIDPLFGKTLRQAIDQGLQVRAFRFAVTPEGVHSPAPIPLDL